MQPKLMYRYVVNWRHDPYEGWYTSGFSTLLHYWDEQAQMWQLVPTQEWSDKKKDQLEWVLAHTDFDMLENHKIQKRTCHGWTGNEILKVQKKEHKNER